MEITNDLDNRLKGYYSVPRGRFLLLKNKVLSKEEMILYDASIAFADWDKNHSTYGQVLLTQEQIECLLGFGSGYVSRYGKSLISKGFWSQVGKRIRVQGFDLIEQRLLKNLTKEVGIVDVQKHLANTQTQVAQIQTKVANLQTNSPKGNSESQPQSFADMQTQDTKSIQVSYKDEYKFGIKSDEEYQLVKSRVNKLGELIGNNWLSTAPLIQELVQEHQLLAEKMLAFEIEHDLLPI